MEKLYYGYAYILMVIGFWLSSSRRSKNVGEICSHFSISLFFFLSIMDKSSTAQDIYIKMFCVFLSTLVLYYILRNEKPVWWEGYSIQALELLVASIISFLHINK